MVWSYTLALTQPKDKVRFLIGDTDATSPQVQDEEIAFALSERAGNIYLAGAFLCRRIASRLAQNVSFAIEGIRFDEGTNVEHYNDLADHLEDEATKNAAGEVYVGGVSKSDKATVAADGDRVGSPFAYGMHDNPEAGQ